MTDHYSTLGVTKTATQEDIKQAFHKLAQKYHPDKNPGSKVAEETFKRVSEAYNVLSNPDKRSLYDRTGSDKAIIIPSKKHKYEMGKAVITGDLSSIHLAKMEDGKEVALKIANSSSINDLLENEAKIIKKIRPEGTKDEGRMRFFPQIIESFNIDDGHSKRVVNVFEWLKDFYTLDQIDSAFNTIHGTMRFEHGVWMFNRILECLGHTHGRGIIHGAVLPPHIMPFGGRDENHPMTHGIKLVDWCYSVEAGYKIKAISPTWEKFYPPEVAAKKEPSSATDIYMAAKCIIFVLGGDPETNICPPSVPEYLANFLKGCILANPKARPNDAWALRAEFKEHMEKNYGPRKYHRFDMPLLA